MSKNLDSLVIDVHTALQDIDAVYDKLTQTVSVDTQLHHSDDNAVVVGYYLNVLYGLFENLFIVMESHFGSDLERSHQWHSRLLRRMTMEIPRVRPAVIGKGSYTHLNELRRFRHLFRNAYLMSFDPDRLGMVLASAWSLRESYRQDFEQFLDFLKPLE